MNRRGSSDAAAGCNPHGAIRLSRGPRNACPSACAKQREAHYGSGIPAEPKGAQKRLLRNSFSAVLAFTFSRWESAKRI